MEVLGDDIKQTVKPAKGRMSAGAKLLIAATGGIGVGLSVICAAFVAPAFRKICLPYVPATTQQISNVLSFLPKQARGKLLDIGSGDGRIVVAAANHAKSLNTDGVELNPWLVYYSRFAAFRNGVGKQTRFFRRDLWKFDISSYNYVVIFGVEQMMQDLENKLIVESPNDAKVIACRFPLPKLQPIQTIEDGVNTVWLYDLNGVTKSNKQ